MVREWLIALTEIVVPLIEIIALVIIAFGTIEAFFAALMTIGKEKDPMHFRLIWVRFARWLIAGLTFQLASDIIETSTAPSWEEIGQLAAIAVIRTFLNFFLERDQREVVELVEKDERSAREKTISHEA